MSLKEFDTIIDRMSLALEYSENLGQFVDASRILFQMNEQLPEDLQLTMDELDTPEHAKSFVSQNKTDIKLAIVEYRERLSNF